MDDYAHPPDYNDYMIDLPDPCQNITSVEVGDLHFPALPCEVKSGQNEFKYILTTDDDDNDNNNHNTAEPQCFVLSPGDYTVEEIIEALQSGFTQLSAPLEISITNSRVRIHRTDKLPFELINDATSLLNHLGFARKKYRGLAEYKSENSPVASRVYMYIDTISKDEPIGAFDLLNPPMVLRKELPSPIAELKEILIKFKNRLTSDNDLFDFKGRPHRMKLSLKAQPTPSY